jgi:RND family efflux transporter MFP subunit
MNPVQAFRTLCVLLLALLALAASCDDKHPQAVATPPPVVMVSQPVERTVTDYQVFTARTQAVQSVDIKSRVTGYLTGILFKDGQEVKAGDVLFQIDDRPYKATLDQALATLEFNKAALVKAQAEYDIGLSVQKQNPGAISKDDLTKRLGARDEAKASVDQGKAAVESAQLNYGWCKVTSPISGMINRHFIDIGNLVSQDMTTLTNIVSLRPMWAYFDVDENTARRYQEMVQMGQAKSVRTNELPVDMALTGDQGFPVKGVVDFLSNQLDPNTGSIRVRARFPNENGSLIAGLFGRIRVPIGLPHQALLVADSAIGTNQGQRFVLVVNDQNEVEYRPVEVDQLHDGLREVQRFREVTETGADGKGVLKKVEVLKPTDRVIVDGLQRVRPGVKVDPKPVDMATLLVKPEPGAKKATPKSK